MARKESPRARWRCTRRTTACGTVGGRPNLTPARLLRSERFLRAVAEERERLRAFYGVGLLAYAGQREQWASALERVLKGDRDNRYYRWFGGTGGSL